MSNVQIDPKAFLHALDAWTTRKVGPITFQEDADGFKWVGFPNVLSVGWGPSISGNGREVSLSLYPGILLALDNWRLTVMTSWTPLADMQRTAEYLQAHNWETSRVDPKQALIEASRERKRP